MGDEHNTHDDADRLARELITEAYDACGIYHISVCARIRHELSARDAALRDAREQINTEWQEKREIARRGAAKDAVVTAARRLLSGERGFHSDHEGIAAARQELRDAIARLDAVPDAAFAAAVQELYSEAQDRGRAAERASIVAMISRFEAERMEGKQLEEADGDPLEAEVFGNQVIAARMIRKSIERGNHAQLELRKEDEG